MKSVYPNKNKKSSDVYLKGNCPFNYFIHLNVPVSCNLEALSLEEVPEETEPEEEEEEEVGAAEETHEPEEVEEEPHLEEPHLEEPHQEEPQSGEPLSVTPSPEPQAYVDQDDPLTLVEGIDGDLSCTIH